MICPKCGTSFDGRFCHNCGAVSNESFQNEANAKPRKKRGRKVLVGILIAFGIILLLLIFASIGSDSTSVSQTPDSLTEGVSEGTATAEPEVLVANAYTFFQAMEDNGIVPYMITANAKQFLRDHEALFPTDDPNAASAQTDFSIEYKHLAKNVSSYGTQLMYLNATVVQVDEFEIMDEIAVTALNISDGYANQYYVFYKGKLDNVFEGDAIEVYGLPLDMSSFDNTEGGQTLTPVLAGSSVSFFSW